MPNLVVAKVGVGGKVCLFTSGGGHLIADVNGFFPGGSSYEAVQPERLLDTRRSVGYVGAKPVAGSTVAVQVTGVGAAAVPADARAVVVNVTQAESTAGGFVTVWPCGSPRPLASNLNVASGGTRPNLVVSEIGTGGQVCLYSSGGGHLIADVSGYLKVR